MNPEKVLRAVNIGETSDWEFKSARGGFPFSFWETYSAMANTDGGIVLLGVAEKNGKAEIEGLTSDQLNQYQKKLWDELNNSGRVNRNLLSPQDVQVLTVGNKLLLAVRIPRANHTQSPIYLGLNPLTNTYRRCHEGDYRCDEDQVRRMLSDASSIPRDYRILRGFTLNDLDPVSIDQYRRLFSTHKENHPWSSLPTEQFLKMLGGWKRDREAGEEGITLGALLMFGRHPAITEGTSSYFVDYREKLDPELRWSHRIYPDGTWEPNLFQFYKKVWPHLSADLKVPFHLEGIQRIDETPVHKALREALVNALIHSDYFAPGGVVIERYRDRFVLDNPGTLLMSLEQLRRGGISECRNKVLQGMFMMIGGGEKAGSGIHRIQSEWKNQHWRAPAFSTQDRPERVRLVLPMVSLIPEETLASLERRFGQRIKGLKKLEIEALVTAEVEGEVSNARLQELETAHPADITQALQSLCSKGMLFSDNRRRWSCYRIPKGLVHKDSDSPHISPDSPHISPDSPHISPDSPHISPDSPHMDDNDLKKIVESVAVKKRMNPSEVRKAIQDLCQGRYLEAALIAKLLTRTQKNLRDRFLTQMVKEGLLELRYPETPNRPDQAYRAKSACSEGS